MKALIFAAGLGELLSPSLQVRHLAPFDEDRLSTLNQQLAKVSVTSFRDAELLLDGAALIYPRPQAEVGCNAAISLESPRV